MKSRVLRLRWALLAAAGAVPLACGGHTEEPKNEGRAGTKGDAVAGSGNHVGAAAGEGGSGGGGSLHGGSGGEGGGRQPVCTSPEVDALTELIRCAEGYLHRPNATGCHRQATSEPLPEGGAGGRPSSPTRTDCYDANSYGGGSDVCDTCETDADCASGRICICSGDQGVCMPSDCKTDSDCGPGLLCASYHQGCGPSGFACQATSDECRLDGDCEFGVCGFETRGASQPGRRICDDTVCGRPFVVEASARVAPTTARGDWCASGAAPSTRHLTAGERSALAEHWTRLGQMEHASIAAFARFQLQLLALGAPADLVEECNRALADETAHAKLCFAIASAYAGRVIGPGPLEIAGSLGSTTLSEVVELVILEGCYGETSAAIEALEAAELASDPFIVDTYSRIARDEQRHSELAFRFLRWAMERRPDVVAPLVTRALTERARSSPAASDIVEACLYAILRRKIAA